MRALLLLFSFLLALSPLFANPAYVGYSGSPGRGTCASSCHGLPGGTVQVVGLPGAYTPSQAYLITIRKMSGLPIKNFNASVRIGTGSVNAGIISAGLFTGTYNVFGETNGVHMTTLDHDSATFTWTAPAVGMGIVRLYVGAHQGPRDTGTNTTIVTACQELIVPPGQASAPTPGDGQTGVTPDAALQWQAGIGATSHDINFGTENPPPLLVQFFEGTFFDPDPDMAAGTTYYWRIDARNSSGVTEGNIWQFTIMNIPGPATQPIPADSETNVTLPVFLEWTPDPAATSHDVYFGTSPDTLPFEANVQTPTHQPLAELLPATTYYWRVDERNAVGVTTGNVWNFTMEASAADDGGAAIPSQVALGPVYPNPFNATVTIPFALPQAGEIRIAIYDVLGREISVLARGTFAAGMHSVSWTKEDAGSGLYFVKLTTPAGAITAKMVALK